MVRSQAWRLRPRIGPGTAIGVAAAGEQGPPMPIATARIGSVNQTVEAPHTVMSSLKLTPSFPTSRTPPQWPGDLEWRSQPKPRGHPGPRRPYIKPRSTACTD